MRRIPILNIIPSTSVGIPSSIEIGTDFTNMFHGKEWINETVSPVVRYPFYAYDTDSTTNTPNPPAGSRLLTATTFEIVGNTKYAGKYTVYTKPNSSGLSSSSFSNSKTVIRVNESIAPIGNEDSSLLSTGFITNISTYKFTITGETDLVLLEGAVNSIKSFELVGKLYSGWGEILQQNFLRDVQNFAGNTAPVNPLQGQLWFDTSTSVLKIMPTVGGTWTAIGSGGSNTPAPVTSSSVPTLIAELKTADPASSNTEAFWTGAVILPSADCTFIPDDANFKFNKAGVYEIHVVGESNSVDSYGGPATWPSEGASLGMTLAFNNASVIPRSNLSYVKRNISKVTNSYITGNLGITQTFYLNVPSVSGVDSTFNISSTVNSLYNYFYSISFAVSVKRVGDAV